MLCFAARNLSAKDFPVTILSVHRVPQAPKSCKAKKATHNCRKIRGSPIATTWRLILGIEVCRMILPREATASVIKAHVLLYPGAGQAARSPF